MVNLDKMMMDEPAYMAPVRRAQIENLYCEAMLLVDEAQHVFERDRGRLTLRSDPEFAVDAMTEAMLTMSRLSHVMAWLLHQRAMIAQDPTAQIGDIATILDDVIPADWSICQYLPESIRQVTIASERLVERLIRLDNMSTEEPISVPVHHMMAQLRARL